MKHIIRIIIIVLFITICMPSAVLTAASAKDTLQLSQEELKWIEDNKERSLTVGMTPQTGFEYFKYENEEKGYFEPLLQKMSEDLGLKLSPKVSPNWNEIYTGLQNRTTDIVFGANETEYRSKFMSFSKPILKIPYAIIAKKDGPVHTIGDLDNRRVGFLKDDFAVDGLSKLYSNIYYHRRLFLSDDDGIEALRNELIDAYVTPGGPDIYEYIYKYPELSYTFKINSLTSDITFSTRKEDKILVDIINKEISSLEKDYLPKLITEAQKDYNLKVMNLTVLERNWLLKDGTAVVGITKEYLPFDYYENGQYKGIDANILKEISNMTGIKLQYNYGDFGDLENKLKNGEIDILNIAKTYQRMNYVIYTEPFSTERDIIVGRKEQKEVKDIFGLEGKRVAVIKGFWHYDMLVKNLTNVKIIQTNSIQESMKLVELGQADYLIENPTVVRYYTEELQYFDLVQRGTTSTDSFLYFGVSKNKPELASIINKVMPLIDIEELSRKGYEEVPHKDNRKNYERLVFAVSALVIVLILVIMYVIKLFRDLINMKTEQELLKQREYLLSIDALTELHNRNYLNTKVLKAIETMPFPQVLIAADLNDLKVVNDSFGHAAGDMLLMAFAHVLRAVCPENGHLFRIGGDEFIIILTGSSEEQAENIIKEIRETARLKSLNFCEDNRLTLTAALGHSIRYSTELSFEELSKKADFNMYKDKRGSKKL